MLEVNGPLGAMACRHTVVPAHGTSVQGPLYCMVFNLQLQADPKDRIICTIMLLLRICSPDISAPCKSSLLLMLLQPGLVEGPCRTVRIGTLVGTVICFHSACDKPCSIRA